ncbi:MAG: hypothetical protein GF308_17480 [Candidatus Heimdallarchaeota archaeon]|nr:hypothetical protein [Candidatus Heimdallarchaeota archaeon]
MVVSIVQAIPSILSLVCCLIILFFLSMNYLVNRFLPSLLFIFFFLGITFWSVTKLVSVLLPQTTDSTFVLIWKMASLSLLILSLLIITFYRDLVMYSALSLPSVFAAFFAGITLGSLWFGNFVEVNYSATGGWNTNYEKSFYLILLVYLVLVYVLMFIMLFRGLQKAQNQQQRQQIWFIILGLAIASIGGTAVNFLLNLFFPNLGDLDLIFVVIGFGIVALAYLKSPTQIYFAPISAYYLLVIDNNGVPLLSHNFFEGGEEALTLDSALISGALSGIISLLKEALESKHTPNIVHFRDRILLLEKTESALFCVIADRDSMVLRSALKDFAREFELKFKDVLKDWQGLVNDFDEAYHLIQEDFAFLLKGKNTLDSK